MAADFHLARPSKDQDRPHAGTLLAVALTALGAGLALAGWSLDRDLAAERGGGLEAGLLSEEDGAPLGPEALDGPGTEAAPSPSPPEAPTEAPGTAGGARGLADEPTGEEPEAPTEPAGPTGDAEAGATPGTQEAPALPPRRAATTRLVRGRLAYIQCAGRRPCPRDRDMEAAVWEALETLPTCAAGPTEPGAGDLRVGFAAGAGPELVFRAPPEGAPLPGDALEACLAPALAGVRTTLSVERVLVSFRFALERD